MPPGALRTKPVCNKCGRPHWNVVSCEKAVADDDKQAAGIPRTNAARIVHRPREGYRDWGDQLDPATQRIGRNTFVIRREPGQKHGSYR